MPSYLLDISINARDGATGPVTKAESSFASLAKTVGKTLAVGFLAAGTAAVAFGVKAVQMASDAEETKSKFNVVFKDMAGEVGAWSDSVANAMGLTKAEAKGMLASVQDLLVPFGMARDEASRMSQDVLTLAGDMASFNNLNTADVVRDINSALVGETEPMKKYGVILNQTAIQAKALEMGLIDANGEMSNSAKAAATMALIMASTSDAQGDLGRTQDSFANQMRVSQASVKDFTTEMGAVLLPMLTPVLTKFNDLISVALPALVEGFKTSTESIKTAWATDWGEMRTTVTEFSADAKTELGSTMTEITELMRMMQTETGGDWETWTGDLLSETASFGRYTLSQLTQDMRGVRGGIQFWMALVQGDWEGAWSGLATYAEGEMDSWLNYIEFVFGPHLRNQFALSLHLVWSELTGWASDISEWWKNFFGSFTLPSWLGGTPNIPAPPVPPPPPPPGTGPSLTPSGFTAERSSLSVQQNFYGMESAGSLKRAAEVGVLAGARAVGIA